MSFRIDFDHRLPYTEIPQFAPQIEARLISAAGAAEDALLTVDSGATWTLLSGERALHLGLDLLEGERLQLHSMGGMLEAYLHEIRMEICGHEFECRVAFVNGAIPRELLGRNTVWEKFDIAFRELSGELFLRFQEQDIPLTQITVTV